MDPQEQESKRKFIDDDFVDPPSPTKGMPSISSSSSLRRGSKAATAPESAAASRDTVVLDDAPRAASSPEAEATAPAEAKAEAATVTTAVAPTTAALEDDTTAVATDEPVEEGEAEPSSPAEPQPEDSSESKAVEESDDSDADSDTSSMVIGSASAPQIHEMLGSPRAVPAALAKAAAAAAAGSEASAIARRTAAAAAAAENSSSLTQQPSKKKSTASVSSSTALSTVGSVKDGMTAETAAASLGTTAAAPAKRSSSTPATSVPMERLEAVAAAKASQATVDAQPVVASDGTILLASGEPDWKHMSIETVLGKLSSGRDGLSGDEAEARLAQYGPNQLAETHISPLLIFLSFMWNPLSWAMEVAAIIAIVLLDYVDFALILCLLLLNATIGYLEERSAGDAVAALMGQLAPVSKVKRNGAWANVPASQLVPGDVVRVRLGDVVPADIKLLEGDQLKIDQSSLTGESLPVTKYAGDQAYSGSIVKQGETEAVVYATGGNTFFGKAANLISETESSGHLQQVLTSVGNFCLVSIFIWCIIELAVQFGVRSQPCEPPNEEGNCPTLSNMLVIIVGGIPVAMPTVLSVTMAIGATRLARKKAIVTRLTAIEELAGMEILCSDKTGTLTLNELTVDQDGLHTCHAYAAEDILRYGALSARIENNEPIDVCIHEACREHERLWDEWELLHYVPFDPVNKRTIATVRCRATGAVVRAVKGAPQVAARMDAGAETLVPEIGKIVDEFAGRGYRALGVAVSVSPLGVPDDATAVSLADLPSVEETEWQMVGLIPMFDPPRVDSGETIRRAKEMGVDVKMITGDQLAIAKETCRQLGIPNNIHTTDFFNQSTMVDGVSIERLLEKADGFAEVFPEHKFDIVRRLQEIGHVVGMTGDGVNDAPALKKADIGIAVADATDAARSAADIVLLTPGLSVIIDAMVGSRKIFQRMRNYAMYSVTTTVRIVLTFGLLTVIYNWYFPTIVVVILAILNDGTVITISKDRVRPSPTPDAWRLKEIFAVAIFLGAFLAFSNIILFEVVYRHDWPASATGLRSLNEIAVTNSGLLGGDCGPLLTQAVTTYSDVYKTTNTLFPSPVVLSDYVFDAAPAQFANASLLTNSLACTASATPPAGYTVATTSVFWAAGSNQINAVSSVMDANGASLCASLRDCQLACACGEFVDRNERLRGLIYLFVSITGQAVIFVTRAATVSWLERPATILMFAFAFAQLVATFIGVYGFNGYPSGRTGFQGCGWGYALMAWLWALITFLPLDLVKHAVLYCLSHRLSNLYSRTTFTTHLNAGHPSGRHLAIAPMASSAGEQRVAQRHKSKA